MTRHSEPAGRGGPAEVAEVVTRDILTDIRNVLPGLLDSADRAFVMRFEINFRDGVVDRCKLRLSDDYSHPIYHANAGEPDEQLRKLEKWLRPGIAAKVTARFHGQFFVTVSIKERTVGFGVEQERQKLYYWGRK